MLRSLRDETLRGLFVVFLIGGGITALFMWIALGDGWVSQDDVAQEFDSGRARGLFSGFQDARDEGIAAGVAAGRVAGAAQTAAGTTVEAADAGFAQGWNDAITRAIDTAIPARLGLVDALAEWRALRLPAPVAIPPPPAFEELEP